jgi:hypothetical protein
MSGALKEAANAQTTWTTGGLDQLAGAGGGLGGLQKGWEDITGQTAADEISDAAETSAEYQREALELFQKYNDIPEALRGAAITQMAQRSGIFIDPDTQEITYGEPTAMGQQQMIDQAMDSPLYSAIMGTREAGEEALSRRAAAGSGLRGGATTSSLIDYNTQLANQALLNSYNEQVAMDQRALGELQSIGMLPSTSGQQAGMIGGIGNTLAQGQIAGAQAQQQALGGLLGFGGTLGAAAISDERLKIIDRKVSDTAHPYIDVYEWEWNDKAEQFGKTGREKGYIAQEVEKVWPEFVTTNDAGYKMVYKEALEQKLEEMTNG